VLFVLLTGRDRRPHRRGSAALRFSVGRLLGYFGRGLVLIAPIAITIAVCVWVLSTVDSMIGVETPGVGLAITVGIITLVGFLGSNLITRSALNVLDRVFEKLPFVRLLYGAIRDVLNAFVGEKRRFDQPVSVRIDDAGSVRLFGFVTQESLSTLGLPGHVSVYCPHSYNFSGQLIVVASDRVERLEKPSADVMAFIVSGGVAGLPPGGSAGVVPEVSEPVPEGQTTRA
jgi:uncharacterized membrane protein